ncbi:MAG: lysophospholipid acyltransferase family protein [candidate division Zixibacteria bacterium]|nr:lysophospholipid acyltransferase family protein [candidate division Zixibacteria bacterium]
MGKLCYFLITKARKQTIENLKIAFKGKNEVELRRLSLEVFENLGKNTVDAIRLKNANWNEVSQMVEVEGMEHFDRAYKLGKGLVALTGHIGNFELIATYFALAGYKVSIIGRELYDKRLDKLLVENREKAGIRNIPTTAKTREVVKALKSGRALGVLIDQDSFRVRGIFVNFFGRPAKTPIGPILLAQRTGSPIVPLAIVRKEDDNYKMIIREEIKTETPEDKEKGLVELTQKGTKFLEDIIREYPAQWVWMHNRWASQPEDKAID